MYSCKPVIRAFGPPMNGRNLRIAVVERDPLHDHPHGKVPFLKDGASMVFEQTAIALYLADKFPDARLGPAIGDPARGAFLTMLAYYSGVLEPGIHVEIHEVRCAARDGRLGRFRRGDDFRQRAHR